MIRPLDPGARLRAAASLVRKIAENYKLPYYTLSPTYSICKDHGYLSGEQYKCPICGATTEVYSRITGYYRPVQNWNDGKAQEFKDRKVYNIGRSHFSREQAAANTPDERVNAETETTKTPTASNAEAAAAMEGKGEHLYLFTTKTCPNCRMADSFLTSAHLAYDKIDAEEHADLVSRYGVRQAPTLVVVHGDQFEAYRNASEIKRYAEQR